MKNFLIVAFFIFTGVSSCAQFLIENNNSREKAALQVKTETGYFRMPDESLCLMWIKEFNAQGLLTLYKDHWQCGQPYWTYHYEYDKSGKCTKSYKGSYKDSFKRNEMQHKFNDEGQLVERHAIDTIAYPTVELFTYDSLGNIMTVTFSGPEKNGEKHPWSKNWNGDKSYKIHVAQDIRDENNKLKWTIIRNYEFYE